MGVVAKTYHDSLINPVSDRNNNRVRVYKMDNDEVVIHFRNLKIVLHKQEEIREWRDGFTKALEKLKEGKYFENDI